MQHFWQTYVNLQDQDFIIATLRLFPYCLQLLHLLFYLDINLLRWLTSKIVLKWLSIVSVGITPNINRKIIDLHSHSRRGKKKDMFETKLKTLSPSPTERFWGDLQITKGFSRSTQYLPFDSETYTWGLLCTCHFTAITGFSSSFPKLSILSMNKIS